jgi:hypothetical protein
MERVEKHNIFSCKKLLTNQFFWMVILFVVAALLVFAGYLISGSV